MIIQNPDSEEFQEVSDRGLAIFSVLKKTESQAWGRNGGEKNRVQELFFRTLKLASPLSLFPEVFQDQGSGYSLRVSSVSL